MEMAQELDQVKDEKSRFAQVIEQLESKLKQECSEKQVYLHQIGHIQDDLLSRRSLRRLTTNQSAFRESVSSLKRRETIGSILQGNAQMYLKKQMRNHEDQMSPFKSQVSLGSGGLHSHKESINSAFNSHRSSLF